jgi:hypothetical protein
MVVDRKWPERNLGLDPVGVPESRRSFLAASTAHSYQDFHREIIDDGFAVPVGPRIFPTLTATFKILASHLKTSDAVLGLVASHLRAVRWVALHHVADSP